MVLLDGLQISLRQSHGRAGLHCSAELDGKRYPVRFAGNAAERARVPCRFQYADLSWAAALRMVSWLSDILPHPPRVFVSVQNRRGAR